MVVRGLAADVAELHNSMLEASSNPIKHQTTRLVNLMYSSNGTRWHLSGEANEILETVGLIGSTLAGAPINI